jgi:histidine triad (HIT) family protein
MRKCIFCEIYNSGGETVVIKRSDHFVIFDKFPASLGHILIITSKHYKNLLATPQHTINSMMETAKEIGKTFKERLDADGIKIVINTDKPAGQEIMHMHIHVIPRYLPHKHPRFEPHKEMTEKERKSMRKRIVTEIENQTY